MMWAVVLYVYAWLFRIYLVRSALGGPRFHGPDWCFDCRVPPGFYEREGRDIMRTLRIRILAPLPFEAAIGAVLWWGGHWIAALAVQAFVYIAAPFYHAAVFRGQARRAWQYAIFEEPPASGVAVSLSPRRLADYSQPWLERTLTGAITVSLILLAVAFTHPDPHENLTTMVFGPCVALYACLGLALLKRAIVSWRISVTPAVQPELFTEWQDSCRRLFAMMCDYLRTETVSALLAWSVLQAWPTLWHWRSYVMLAPLLSVCLLGAIPLFLAERRLLPLTRNLKAVTSRWRPSAAPPPEGRFYLLGRVCSDPEEDQVLVRGPRGMALNTASRRTRLYVAYLAGWPALVVVMLFLKQPPQ